MFSQGTEQASWVSLETFHYCCSRPSARDKIQFCFDAFSNLFAIEEVDWPINCLPAHPSKHSSIHPSLHPQPWKPWRSNPQVIDRLFPLAKTLTDGIPQVRIFTWPRKRFNLKILFQIRYHSGSMWKSIIIMPGDMCHMNGVNERLRGVLYNVIRFAIRSPYPLGINFLVISESCPHQPWATSTCCCMRSAAT